MSLKTIREQVLNFLSQSSPSVMAIKGEWGVGKTYGWEALLLEAQKEKMLSAKRYSYVSLFGISSLDKLKYTIFENSITKDSIGTEPNLESLRTNTLGMLEVLGRGSWSKLKEMPFIKSAAPAVEAFSFMSISETLICIDDLERKGAALDLKDVLGLVSLLKEKKKCKVILLLNAGTEATDDYETYKEKVIDIELDFSPTPEESAAIAYDNRKPYHKELAAFTVSLGIKNIRVLTKIGKYIDLAIGCFEGVEPELKTQLLQTTALFSWAYYCSVHDQDIPSLDFIESVESIYYVDAKKLSDKEKLWKNILMGYSFTRVDVLDREIAKLVRQGYLDRETFTIAMNDVNQQVINNKKNNSYRSAWDSFHNSFSDNQQLVVQKLYDAFVLNVHQVTPSDLDGLVNVFRTLEEDVKATSVIDEFISKRRAEVELFNPDNFHFNRRLEDEEIIDRFSAIYSQERPRRTIKEVLERISGQNGWNDEDVDILSDSTEDEYYRYFKELDGPNLTSHISTCLKFGGFSNGSDKMELIASKAKSALEKIASESKLNEMRMRKFGL
nr:MAG TPA_asm: KAP family P-loop domain [Caudoviricetes sp.]